MTHKRLFIGPYLSCFFSVYSNDGELIKLQIDRPMTEKNAITGMNRLKSEQEKGRIL